MFPQRSCHHQPVVMGTGGFWETFQSFLLLENKQDFSCWKENKRQSNYKHFPPFPRRNIVWVAQWEATRSEEQLHCNDTKSDSTSKHMRKSYKTAHLEVAESIKVWNMHQTHSFVNTHENLHFICAKRETVIICLVIFFSAFAFLPYIHRLFKMQYTVKSHGIEKADTLSS